MVDELIVELAESINYILNVCRVPHAGRTSEGIGIIVEAILCSKVALSSIVSYIEDTDDNE